MMPGPRKVWTVTEAEELENTVKALINSCMPIERAAPNMVAADAQLLALRRSSDDAQLYAEEYQSLLRTLGRVIKQAFFARSTGRTFAPASNTSCA